MSGSADRRFCGLRLSHESGRGPQTRWSTLHQDRVEQSENVYENKGQVQKVAEPHIARPNADHTSSGRSPEGGARPIAVSTHQITRCKIEGTKRECL